MSASGLPAPSAQALPPRVTLRKDCLGGDKIVDVDMGRRLQAEHLDRVQARFEQVQRTVLDGLPKPFFRLDVAGRFLLTGILGEPIARFTVRRHLAEEATDVALAATATMLASAGT